MIGFRSLAATDVEARVAQVTNKGCQLLLYKDARCDMRILDEAVGAEMWQCSYERIGSTLFCRVGILSDGGEWVWKQDCGVPSNMEGEKGEASDAFKRACFKWGIGRELYTAPFVWVPASRCTVKPGKNGKPVCYDRFSVSHMEVGDGRISGLSVVNESRGGEIAFEWRLGSKQSAEQKPSANGDLNASKQRLKVACMRYADAHGADAQAIMLGVTKRPDYAGNAENPAWFDMVAEELASES